MSGFKISFAAPSSGGGKSIVTQTATAGGVVDQAGSLKKSEGAAVLNKIDLGALHAALQGEPTVSEAKFGQAIKSLMPAAERPSPEILAALFKAFDADSSGAVDQAELVAGCQALCSGDEAAKLRLAFKCFDGDGDGHLTSEELKQILRGTIEPAVSALHGAIEFAAFGADEGGLVEAINEEAGGSATLQGDVAAGEGMVKVDLKTKVGVATIVVPSSALADDPAPGAGALSLDAFLSALVSGAMAKYDADGSGTIEAEEFVAFAKENPFLQVWFGSLTDASARKFDARTDV